MQFTPWPSTPPESFRRAAARLLSGDDPDDIARRLRRHLGVDQRLRLDPADLGAVVRRICGAHDDAARSGLDDRPAVVLAVAVGAQLRHEHPMSSLLWDDTYHHLADVLASHGHRQVRPDSWQRGFGGRTLVVEVTEPFPALPDQRSLSLRWGMVLDTVRFCRHRSDAGHGIDCCAVVGDMGSIRAPHGRHAWVVTVGLLIEWGTKLQLRVLGRDAFRARIHRLAAYCDLLEDPDRLADLVRREPWRAGIGIADRLRDAGVDDLRRLLDG